MKQKLFKKYFFSMSLIILISLIVMMLTLVFIFNNFLSNSKYEVLSKSCNSVVDYLNNEQTENSKQNIFTLMSTVSKVSDIDIFICDSNGKISICSCNECSSGEKCTKFGKYIPKRILDKSKVKESLDFGTLDVYSNAHFSVSKPFFDESGTVKAIVFSTTSANSVKTLITTVFRFCLLSAIIPIIIMFFAIFAMSYRMVRPLRLMSDAAKAMAKGDFSKRIPVTSDDEIGELAVSFNLMTNSLSQLEGMRRSFVANVSHELKTPMTTIGGFIDGIIDGTIEEDKQNYYLGIVSEEVKRLSRLVQTMLNMSKLESGEYVLKPELFDMRELLFTIAISQEQQIEHKQIEISGLDTIESVSLKADKDLIHQVVYNLVDNAVKFTPENGKISFSLTRDSKQLTLKISNSGRGIPKEDLPYIFERFYKADKSRSANKNSTGLGLYIAKNIVSAHGGKISAQSEENEITTFTINLPL